MIERAIVNEVQGDIVLLGCEPKGSCESCGSGFCSPRERIFKARNRHGLPLDSGDIVDVYLAPGKTVAAGFVVLMVPLLGFIFGFLAAGRLFAGASEAVKALTGLAGLALGFLVSWYYGKKRKSLDLPEVVALKSSSVLQDG